ncbi:MAG: hypothetical protein WA884_08690, partial [Methyloceanibacter sp.]
MTFSSLLGPTGTVLTFRPRDRQLLIAFAVGRAARAFAGGRERECKGSTAKCSYLANKSIDIEMLSEVLDITIVSVAIPHMLGSFGATSDQITWVLTSY